MNDILEPVAGGVAHKTRMAVKNDTGHIYVDGNYVASKAVGIVRDIVNGAETEAITNLTIGCNLIAGWAGTEGNMSGTPATYGWAYSNTTATIPFNNANAVSGVRFIDLTNSSTASVVHTPANGTTFLGRIMYIRR